MTGNGSYQEYDDASGDAVIRHGVWLCEHTDGTVRLLRDPDPSGVAMIRVTCVDCGTVYLPWTYRMRRLAKAVVQRV